MGCSKIIFQHSNYQHKFSKKMFLWVVERQIVVAGYVVDLQLFSVELFQQQNVWMDQYSWYASIKYTEDICAFQNFQFQNIYLQKDKRGLVQKPLGDQYLNPSIYC
eukprot:TRINITY_DN6793_c0_g1_i22.p12 TRINITY_DN6793_c0_g1~~TRINITY_DN6793_c0_g1_i22.p12  ORF type:complete len:106 (-),score=4.94 TRINITY_DN6793_c0_g1_i22:1217-1534(-)